jgi:hypothetical protein
MTGKPAAYFRVVAVDFDGTLAEGTAVAETLEALTDARARQIRIILVTGRIMAELRRDFPQVDDYVDAVVAGNGCVVSLEGGIRRLAVPVPIAVSEQLTALGVAHRRGQVLPACSAFDDQVVARVIRERGRRSGRATRRA